MKKFYSLKQLTRENVLVIILLLTCSLAVSYEYYQNIDSPQLFSRIELHDKIVTGAAPSPYQFRVLVPFSTNFVKKIFDFLGPERAFLLTYSLYDLAAVTFTLFALYWYLKIWFNQELTLIGTILVAAVMPVNFYFHYYQPWSLIEIGFFSLGLYFIYKARLKSLAILVAIASLNRETALFIPIMYLLPIIQKLIQGETKFQESRHLIIQGIGLILIWFVIFFGLRIIFGQTEHVVDLTKLLIFNLTLKNLFKTGIALTVFWGFFWYFILKGYLVAPAFIKATSWILPLYTITIFFWSVWFETRVLMSLYPIFISLGLCAAFPKQIQVNLNDS